MKAIKKRKKLIITLVIIVVAIIAMVLFVKQKLGQVAEQSNRIEIEEVEKRDLSDFISLTGKVSGESNKNYSSIATAEIEQLNVAVGDEVHVGDVLVTLKKDSIQSQIDIIENSMSNAAALEANQSKLNQHALDQAKTDQKNQLAAASQAISDAESNYNSLQNRIKDLNNQIASVTQKMNAVQAEAVDEAAIRSDLADEDEVDEAVIAEAIAEAKKAAEVKAEEAKSEYAAQINELQGQLAQAQDSVESANQAIKEAKANYNSVKSSTDEAIYAAQNTVDMQKYSSSDDSSSKSQLEELYDQLNNCTITAQSDGIVTAVNASVGDMNTPNATLISVESDDTLMMTASVDEKDILKLQEGMKAIVTSDALEDQQIKGEVTKVVRVFGGSSSPAEGMEGASASGGFSVQIKLEDCELLSGMTAKAKITLTDKSNVLCVPYDLVQEDESGKSFVLCAEENGDGTYTAVRKNITVGEEINYYVVVTGGDVSEGDYIIMDFSVSEGDVFEADIFSDEDEDSDGASVEIEAVG